MHDPRGAPRMIKPAPAKRKGHVIRLLEEGDVQKEIDVIKEIPLISKVEKLDNVRFSPGVRYDVQINDRSLSDLSRDQVVEIQRVIASFLAGRKKRKNPAGS